MKITKDTTLGELERLLQRTGARLSVKNVLVGENMYFTCKSTHACRDLAGAIYKAIEAEILSGSPTGKALGAELRRWEY